MPTWKKTLRAAGIHRLDLCDDYTRQRALVKEFAKKEYLAVRLLLPTALHPPVIAAVAFMHSTDERIDTGAVGARKHALAEWTAAALTAVDGPEPSENATLRTLADAVRRHPGLRRRIDTFLDGAHLEVDYTGHATEQDLQTYVDGYSLPAFMLMAAFVAPTRTGGRQASFEAACRALIEAMQRVDYLDDLAEDAADGVIGIPYQDLARHQLTVADISPGAHDAVRHSLTGLVHEQADLAQHQLHAAGVLPQLVEPEVRPFVTALWQMQNLKLSAIRNKGGNLVDGGAEAPMPAVLKILVSQYRAARRARE
ncbi:phytoene/squalene synthase family protein [Streptomyces sp. NPDC059255]|uniref:phytoene/squalene synthase family protein n=1 Tax=Streptomyces sp. NPDC059255 TaxID=3346793 RepID=UPI00369D6436